MKKLFISISMFLAFMLSSSIITTTPVSAAGGGRECLYLLGFTSWDCGVDLNSIESEDQLKQAIWIIAANVASDFTVAGTYLVLMLVIYGGYFYICANGDTGKVATGKKILGQAFVGLAIVLTATSILSAIRIALGANFAAQCIKINDDGSFTSPGSCYDIDNSNTLITGLVQWVIGIAGLVAVAFVIFGGLALTTSTGDPGKITKAKNTIIYALIGLAIVGLAEIITAFVSKMISDANSKATVSYTSSLITSPPPNYHNHKELYETIST